MENRAFQLEQVVGDSDKTSVVPQTADDGQPEKSTNNENYVKLQRTVGIYGAISLIVGTMIGSGIFVSPGGVLNNSKNVWLALVIWLVSGLLSMFGAITYIELSTVVPTSGAEYSYLLAAFGPVPGFINSWAAITLLRPSQLAVICLTCALNMVEPFVDDVDDPTVKWAINILASAVILLLTYINCESVKFATQIQIVFTVAKLMAIVVIVGGGVYKLSTGHTKNLNVGFEGSSDNFGDIARACVSALWAYDGWNQLNLVAEEIKDPYKNLPRAIFIGIPLVTICYLLVNISFLTVIAPDEFAGSGSIAIIFGDRVLGVMSWLMPLAVVMSTFGAGNGVLFTSARITFVAGREGHLPDCISYVDVKRDTPSISLIVNALISILMVIALDINGLIDFFSYAAWIFYGLTAATLLVLRKKMPNAPRPFKAPMWMSFVVILMAIFLTVMPVVLDPKLEYLYAVIFIVAGVFLYIPFVHYKFVLPGMVSISKLIQKTFMVVFSEGLDDDVLIGTDAKEKASAKTKHS